MGIEELKKVLIAVAEVGNVLEKVVTKGNVIAVFNLADEFALLATLNVAQLKAEVLDLDEVEKRQLLAVFEQKFDLEADKVELFVEGVVEIASDISDLIGKIILLFKAK